MSQYQSLKQQNLWPAIDPYFENTTLLLHGNGTNGGQNNTFLDSSSNNFTITRNGNTTQGTFTPYGSNWSNNFGGSTNYYLTIPSGQTPLNLSTGDFTVECWVNLTDISQYALVLTVGASAWQLGYEPSRKLFVYNGGNIMTSSTAITVGTWNHFAWTRSGTTMYLYLNGVQVATASNSSSVDLNGAYIAAYAGGTSSYPFYGSISNLRIVKGTAVYTGAFTPPTSPLTAITNTSLLTCQSNRFIDNSSNAFAITVSGSPSVQRFSPFNPSAPYAAGTIGGSGYFDGSGDYLTYTGNSSLAIGTGAFTMEFWLYKTVAWGAANYTIMEIRDNFTMINLNSGADLHGYLAGSDVGASGTTIGVGQWYHIVMARNGSSSLAIWVNGTRIFSSTNSTNVAGTDVSTSYIGSDHAGQTVPACYIADSRIVVGTDVYGVSNSTITVPTSPLTAVTNTKLLCSYTNGGIIDNAMMNDLETVGNAQISTTQSKFGGASLAFDGNGDYLTAATTPAQQYGTGNFTIEFWFYKTANGSYNYGDSTGDFFLRIGNTGFTVNSVVISTNNSQQITAFIGYNGSSWATTIVSSSTFSLDTWYHVALVRAGTGSNQTTLYVNGTSYGTGTSSTDLTDASFGTALRIGASSSDRYYNGYIDDLRITKGIARYTANFTPQTSQWQDQ
jgi:hypothetical protein